MNSLLMFFAVFFGLSLSGSLLLMVQHLLKARRGEAKISFYPVLNEQIVGNTQDEISPHNKRFRNDGVSIYAAVVKELNIACRPEGKILEKQLGSFK